VARFTMWEHLHDKKECSLSEFVIYSCCRTKADTISICLPSELPSVKTTPQHMLTMATMAFHNACPLRGTHPVGSMLAASTSHALSTGNVASGNRS
jgi:hypothetical protein